MQQSRQTDRAAEVACLRSCVDLRLVRKIEWRLHLAIEWITDLGLRTSAGHALGPSTASGLLRSPLFKGRVDHSRREVSTEGKYEPNVAPPVWAIVELAVAGMAITAVSHVGSNPTYPLKGTIICGECGKPATASTSVGRTNRFGYVHCRRELGYLRIPTDKAE